ncbi:MAG: HNH endonuclease [Terriglobales bacterium]
MGQTESQTIEATSPNGEVLTMRVKLCWRTSGNRECGHVYSAAQLLAKVPDRDFEVALTRMVGRLRTAGITHVLFVQREGLEITSAALVELAALVDIWCAQRDISDDLISKGKMGGRKKNHAMNGWSPTLWLHDDQAPDVTAALWGHPGVRDLVRGANDTAATAAVLDDTYDDLPGLDYSKVGSDGAPIINTIRSEVRRDPKVRALVLQRGNRKCERCGTGRQYDGFLDVHHILGADKGDRVWNCVAICPNCHREAHVAPTRDEINDQLLGIAGTSKPLVRTAARP